MNDRLVPEKHQPHRGSDVEAWIKTKRDEYELHSSSWNALDYLLDDYRTRADYGKFLDSYIDGAW